MQPDFQQPEPQPQPQPQPMQPPQSPQPMQPMQPTQPAGYPPTANPYYANPYPQSGSGNGLSIAGMIVSIFGLLFCWIPFLGGSGPLVGLILSIVGKVKSKKSGTSGGMALAGIIISSIGLVISTIISIFVITAGIGLYSEMSSVCESRGAGQYQKEYQGSMVTVTCDSSGNVKDVETE